MCDPALIDCDFPFDEASEHDADGPKRAHGTVAFQHTRDVVARVVMLTNVAEPPPYQEILALDATIRAAWVSFSSIRLHLANSFSNVLVRAVMLGPHRASSKHSVVVQPLQFLTRRFQCSSVSTAATLYKL
jgi:hypothetical protein